MEEKKGLGLAVAGLFLINVAVWLLIASNKRRKKAGCDA